MSSDGGAASAVTEIEEENAMDPFPRFDVVAGIEADHYYLNGPPENKKKAAPAAPAPAPAPAPASASADAVKKKIMQEWRILERDLPDSIYVRVCEGCIDLMRAAIVGAAGTPYHDGLFFFDICFPLEYPAVPPLVHYRSFGHRINPNLYENGSVCLSLLNTWDGNKSERWNPEESTVLQVLLSIQALVLNEIPYMNEPYRPFSKKKSAAYTEEVFLLSCKSMMLLLRRPPVGFEAFTAAHFRQRARPILAACCAYTSGRAKVGYYGLAAGPPRKASAASKHFKSSMRELFPSLLSAFQKAGAPVEDFSRPSLLDGVGAGKKKKPGFADKIFGMLGVLFGLNKKKKKSNTSSSSKVIPKSS